MQRPPTSFSHPTSSCGSWHAKVEQGGSYLMSGQCVQCVQPCCMQDVWPGGSVGGQVWCTCASCMWQGRPVHPLLKTTLTGLRRTYLRFLVFRPKLTKTKRFPPFLDHMNGKLFLGGSRFWSGKIGPKLALGGHRSQCPAELSFIFNRCPAGNPLFLTDKIYF